MMQSQQQKPRFTRDSLLAFSDVMAHIEVDNLMYQGKSDTRWIFNPRERSKEEILAMRAKMESGELLKRTPEEDAESAARVARHSELVSRAAHEMVRMAGGEPMTAAEQRELDDAIALIEPIG
jgi:hypothetical protein